MRVRNLDKVVTFRISIEDYNKLVEYSQHKEMSYSEVLRRYIRRIKK